MTSNSRDLCPTCKIGSVKGEATQFSFDVEGKRILIEDVPGKVCNVCGDKCFREQLKNQLLDMACEVLTKSHCHTLIGKFDDFIRPKEQVQQFELFDIVQIKDDVNTWDFYDEDLLPGMKGTITGKGEMPFDYIVEFKRGAGRKNIMEAEIDEKDLVLLKRISAI